MKYCKEDVVKKVLDYWYTMEFLSQDKFPRWEEQDKKKAYDAREEEKKKQSAIQRGDIYIPSRKQIKVLNMFCEIKQGMELYETVKKSAQVRGMSRWGNITLYIGKIKREVCIQELARALNAQDDRPEKNMEKIAWASLQIGADGQYVKDSFSLSPVLWAMRQPAPTPESLGYEQYSQEMESYENPLAKIAEEGIIIEQKEKKKQMAEGDEDENKKRKYPLDDEEKYIRKSHYELPMSFIREMEEQIFNKYIGDLQFSADAEVERVFFVSYQLFLDDKIWEEQDEEEYTGLGKGFFLKDLEMVRSMANKLETGGAMQKALFEYIYSGYGECDGETRRERLDLLKPEATDPEGRELKEFYLEKLDASKAPLGKWPSRYMPAFMQQLSINLALEAENTIFSVNGPPGTGKTTLLKEIIANNVVEKAKLLANYTVPDDAFDTMSFGHGEEANHGYLRYATHYYKLKDDHINDFSILVASCNNNAVENITKDIPKESEIIGSLKPNKKDSTEMWDGIQKVRSMFTVSDNKDAIWLKESDEQRKKNFSQTGENQKKWMTDCHDIYFTRYACGMLDSEDVWGLIAAPLGKRSNIRTFYRNVLKNLDFVIAGSADKKKQRLAEYEEAKREFESQLSEVRELEIELEEVSALEICIEECCDDWAENKELLKKLQIEKQQLEEAHKKKVNEISTERQAAFGRSKEWDTIHKNIKAEYEMTCSKCSAMKQEREQLQRMMEELNGNLTAIGKFFKTKKTMNILQMQEVHSRRSAELDYLIWQCEMERSEWFRKIQEVAQERLANRNAEKQIGFRLDSEQKDYERNLRRIEEKISAREEAEKGYENQWKELVNLREYTEKYICLNDDFMKKLLSRHEKESTEAHIKTPWFTEEYNRAREKLFYKAIRLHEAFILASKSCKENLLNLSVLWGEKTDENGRKVGMHPEDRKSAIGPLLQTLFLLVPVVSTTFASVRGFLGDAGPETVGTLIIDEAGQASPQMAVGALYRSRRAIIVGDPKQVEPVVTDDLAILRRAFDEEIYVPYKRKNVSVQNFADYINPYGTWLKKDISTEEKEWVGCPLVVHRRCISPMYDISNRISYGGMMKQQTALPDRYKERGFYHPTSLWIDIKGNEMGNKNHFVKKQGDEVIKILERAFIWNKNPKIFIISPFTSVVRGMKALLEEHLKKESCNFDRETVKNWMKGNIGTVHTFQGREADEVIFLLGCDNGKAAEGAIKWVNSNIVNVAVTRAKYRLYIIGDATAWSKSDYLMIAKEELEEAL